MRNEHSSMNIGHLEILMTVVDHGSFSNAALTLGISQSAVSRAIAALEDELGVSLLTRGRFGARSTLVGERVLSHARQILQVRDHMEQEVNLEKSLQGGRVRIASFRSVATHLLPLRIAQFSRLFPQIEVTLAEQDPNGVEQALLEGQADLGLVPLPRAAEDLETWEIARDEFVVLLPPTPTPVPTTLNWADLSDYAYILYNYAECTSVVRSHWQASGYPLKVAYEVKEDSTIVSMVSQGLGAAILPRLAALPIPPDVTVRSLPVPLERSIGVAVLPDVLHSPAVFSFLDLLRSSGRFRTPASTR